MNQPRVVTARVKQLQSLREERVKHDNAIYLPSSFPFQMPDGKRMMGKFKNELGQETELAIVGQMVFDLNKKPDEENWNTLKVLLRTQPVLQNQIILDDPEENADNDIKRTKMVLHVTSVIDENEKNLEFLGKVYRRLIGPANGITPKQVYRGLTDLAMKTPEKFFSTDGKMIFEEKSFETLSYVDLGIEKGFFHRDPEGFIKLASGETYAKDMSIAAHRLEEDHQTMEALKYHISGVQKTTSPSGFTSTPVDNEFLSLMNQVGEPVDTVNSVSEFGLDSEMKFEMQLDEKIPKLIELNFIEEKKGQFGRLYYVVDSMDKKFKREELSGYFKMNPSHFEDLTLRANI